MMLVSLGCPTSQWRDLLFRSKIRFLLRITVLYVNYFAGVVTLENHGT